MWTGPDAPAGAARDTAMVLRSRLEGARESVLLAGYSFDHARDVLSVNLTERALERNIEVGVLIEDASVASYLAGQWLGLVEAGIVGEYQG